MNCSTMDSVCRSYLRMALIIFANSAFAGFLRSDSVSQHNQFLKNHIHLYYSLWLNLHYFHIQSQKHMGSIRHLEPIIFVWRILTFSLISTGGDGFPHWVFLNSRWSFWCTSHWSFWCTSHWDFRFFSFWRSLFSISLLHWQFTMVFLHMV